MKFLDRLLHSEKQETQLPEGWRLIERPDGSRMLVDPETVEYLESDAPQPTQESLDHMLDGADAFRLVEGGASRGRPLGTNTLLEMNEPGALIELRGNLRVNDGPAGHCMCHGDSTLEFFDKSGSSLAVIAVHHGHTIRWNAWKDDAALIDGRALLSWFAAQGVEQPLRQYEQELQERANAEAVWERWFVAMPSCLQPLLAYQRQFIGRVLFTPEPPRKPAPTLEAKPPEPSTIDVERFIRVKNALTESHPDVLQRACLLLTWFGRGAGPWSGCPVYEEIPELLLLEFPTADLVLAMREPPQQGDLLEGAARFLAGWLFATHRLEDLGSFPNEVRQVLLAHVRRTGDSDKLARAEAALRPVE
ncbi:MAG TPA: hypothetical protein VFO06_01490 [Gemmatimonadales bacterium]|nr:hypothetical protein [Gemmatimonadales bacterium]